MKRIAFNVLLAASLFATAACDNNKTNDSTEQAEEMNEDKLSNSMEDDAEFAVEAANGGMMEVKMGELAQMNGSSADVKEFGKMIVDDHGQANEELKSLAAKKNIMLPTTLGNDMQQKYDEMAKKTGKEFDKEYVDMMVKDHKKDIDAFKEEANEGKDADMKAFAAKTLPTLEMHMQRIQAIQGSMK
jgi:putative membrane protein